jgi:hypothetical protein
LVCPDRLDFSAPLSSSIDPALGALSVTRLRQRLDEPGPKRLLALDGGGLRGLISIGILERLEDLLRRRHRQPGLVLSDYFDLIGGTSTGAIIATLLSLGWSVADIKRSYLDFARQAFTPKKSFLGPLTRILGARFDAAALEGVLRQGLGDLTLGSAELLVGLMIITKRVDTGSVWVLNNVPDHPFYEYNRDMLLWEILRSSTAAPTFFSPSFVADVGLGEEAVFIDGGVSMHNNPGLQLLMVANLEGFALNWPLGEDNLLLCSIGTGAFSRLAGPAEIVKYTNIHWLALLVSQMMKDAAELNQTILQWMSRSPTAADIDLQIKDLAKDGLGPRPLISYLRYDVDLEGEALRELGFDLGEAEVESLRDMSRVQNISQLEAIGRAAGLRQVSDEHFPARFDRDRARVPGT